MEHNDMNDKSSDPVVALDSKRNDLLNKHAELARQWDAAGNVDGDDPHDLAFDLTNEIEDQAGHGLLEIRHVEEEIGETKATTFDGLVVKVGLLEETCAAMGEQREFGNIPEEHTDDLSPPTLYQNIAFAKKLSASAAEDLKSLLPPERADAV